MRCKKKDSPAAWCYWGELLEDGLCHCTSAKGGQEGRQDSDGYLNEVFPLFHTVFFIG